MKTITNGTLSISVKDHGAELASVKFNGREYLWQAHESFWKRHSPVLFPIVGAVWNGEYRFAGNVYKMGQHGFARDMDFALVSESATELWYELTWSGDTLRCFPYRFLLKIGYRIEGSSVRVMWHVENPGQTDLPFQIGAHPAFFWPMLTNDQIEAGVDAMIPTLAQTDARGYFKIDSDVRELPLSVITEGGCVGAESSIGLDEEGYLPLSLATFEHDALIVEDSHIKKVTLCRQDKSPYLSVEFSSPLVGLWSPPGKRAPFVCIEPWYGRTDPAGYTGAFEDKPWVQHLAPGESFDASYTITIY